MQADEINKSRLTSIKPVSEPRMLRRKSVPAAAAAEAQAIEKQAEQLVNEVIENVTNKTALKKKSAPAKVSFGNVHPVPLANLMGRDLLLAEVKYE